MAQSGNSGEHKRFDIHDLTNKMVKAVVETKYGTGSLDHLPSSTRVAHIVECLREAFFPGFHGSRPWTKDNKHAFIGGILGEVRALLEEQILLAYAYYCKEAINKGYHGEQCDCYVRKVELTNQFLCTLPELKRLVNSDVEAAYRGDPAAHNYDEIVFCYPGISAIFAHRIAHELYKLKIPFLPRMISEQAHSRTGCDIHSGAQIGEGFFIDHATGVVIGETAVIGNNVKMYQGSTLGALSFDFDAAGNIVRQQKRHPTIEDDVTIYSNAIVLGGKTVVGKGAVIGGSAFVTSSVPPYHLVRNRPEIKVIKMGKEVDLSMDWVI